MKIFDFGLQYRIYDTGQELSQRSRRRSKKSGSKCTLFKLRWKNLKRCFQFGPFLKKPIQITNLKRQSLGLVIWFGVFENGAKLEIENVLYLLRFSHL